MKPKDEFIGRCYEHLITVDWLYWGKKFGGYNLKTIVDECTQPLVKRLEAHQAFLASQKKDKKSKKNASKSNNRRSSRRNVSAEEMVLEKGNGHDVRIAPSAGNIKSNMGKDTVKQIVREYIKQRIQPLFDVLERELNA